MAALLNEPRMGQTPGADPANPSRALTPQAPRLLEGPVVATLLRLAAPTVALMLLQGVVAAMVAVTRRELGLCAGRSRAMRILLLGLCIGLVGCARVPSGAPEAALTPVTV